jgi:hypothetical protein
MANNSDVDTLTDWQLRELEHYIRRQRLDRELSDAKAKADFVQWAKATLKIGVEYIDYAWNWLLHRLGLR